MLSPKIGLIKGSVSCDGAEVADAAAVAAEGVDWEYARLRETAKKIREAFRSRVNLVVMRSGLLIETYLLFQ
jgi:hypothetical protein